MQTSLFTSNAIDKGRAKEIYFLVGCEESQVITLALRSLGVNAYSCDLKDCSGGYPQYHIKGDVFKAIAGGHITLQDGSQVFIKKWNAAIFHPDCTYLTVSGLHWNYKKPERAAKTEESLKFVRDLMNCNIDYIAIENPVGCISTRIFWYTGGENGPARWEVFPTKLDNGARKPNQTVQPYNFGDDASKGTCLWLKGFPNLINTSYFPPRLVDGKKRWSNQDDAGQNKLIVDGKWLSFNDPLTKEYRSKTYPGIANAIADQWVSHLLNNLKS